MHLIAFPNSLFIKIVCFNKIYLKSILISLSKLNFLNFIDIFYKTKALSQKALKGFRQMHYIILNENLLRNKSVQVDEVFLSEVTSKGKKIGKHFLKWNN